ncbi:hypothetical protein K501DRAFT_203069, partial [Backusella circina FSU 941]
RTANVELNKQITLNGMNGFPDVRIDSFQLPGDAPGGGILMELGTILNSPSPIGVQLGTIVMAVGYDGINLGTVTAEGVNLRKGDNNIILKGTLIPQSDNASLAKVSTLFSNYVSGAISNTSAAGISCAPDGVNPITWLSEGFKTVNLNVALGAGAPLKIINGVSLGYLDLKFDANTPYAPTINGPSVVADYKLPFGFSLNVTALSQNITLAINTTGTETDSFAVINAPSTPAVTDQAAGTITFPLNSVALSGISGKEATYNAYTYALTASSNYSFMVAGVAQTNANTPIGAISLTNISFDVPTSVVGLSFLNSSATVINSIDVTGGTSEALQLAISVSMDNPSDFSISTGDVSFNMGASGTQLGVVTLANLTLARGANTVAATSTFDPNGSDVGKNLLSTFVMGQENNLDITGFTNSTAVTSLAEALGAITLESTLPGLTTAIVQGASLSVLSDSIASGTVAVKVTIADPFTAGLSVTKVVSAATFNGMPLGNIDQDISSNPIVVAGKSTAQSGDLSMTMNFEPSVIALLIRQLAVAAGLDTQALDALFGLGGLNVEGQEDVTATASLFTNFNISEYTLEAMKALKVDLSLTSGITIGQYSTDLSFSQSDVSVSADDSVLLLIPIVGQPIVQQIVDGSVLAFDSVTLSSPTNSGFAVQMKGSISNTGPMDATISFPSPLTVAWQGRVIGTVNMANIEAKADVGASFDVSGQFTVTDGTAMGDFAAYMINAESFEWDITTNDVSVTALGYTFNSISLEKFVTLAGAQGFKNDVTITSFNLPSNDPAGGISLTAQTVIKNPSQVGFNLAGASFENYFDGVDLGPLSSNGAAVFPAQGTANIEMVGRLITQTSAEGIAALTTVFGNYLGGKSTSLTVKGVSGSGPQGEVSWLNTAFKALSIENVILPGPTSNLTLITSINLLDMEIDFTQDPWAPPTSSKNVQAQIQNPFGFPLGVTQLNMNVAATYGGITVATLDVPDNSATTDATGLVTTQFSDVPFKVQDQDLFSNFVALLTLSPSVTFGLEGTSNAIADTAVGTLTLPNIAFNVDTTLAGFADFNGAATIEQLSVTGATADYIIVSLSVSMTNPSQISITLGTINFNVVLASSSTVIGKVYLNNLTITPGTQSYAVEMHLGEGSTDQAAVGAILTDYLTNQNVPLSIVGSETSTDIASLKTALEKVTLATSMQGIQANLVTKVVADIHGDDTTQATGTVSIYNPLDTPFSIVSVKATTNYTIVCSTSNNVGTVISVGVIDFTLPEPATIQPKETQTFDGWPITGIDLFAAIPIAEDPYAIIGLTQTVVTLVDNVYNTGEISYNEVGVPLVLTVGGAPLIDFSDNPPYWDYDCQCAAHATTNVTATNTTLSANTTTTATLNATTTLVPTNATSTVPITTTVSATTTSFVTTTVPSTTTTDDSSTPTATSDPTTTEEPTDTSETQTTLAGTSAPTSSS